MEGPQGWRLVLAAMGVFLAPLALAVVGAVAAGRGAARQSLGAGAGLALGVLGSAVVGRILRRTGRDNLRRGAGVSPVCDEPTAETAVAPRRRASGKEIS